MSRSKIVQSKINQSTISLFALIVVVASLVSCMQESPPETPPQNVQHYACPMECEGSKTYLVPGSCPICKMDLELVERDFNSKI